jgi:hypothetical protein
MTTIEFQRAVQNGLGRAILYARDHDVGEFREIILDACLHCYSADVQCEGTRAPFMYELVDLLPDREFYFSEILRSLPNCGDDWDAVQRFRFASDMGMDGNEDARRAMYENFHPGPQTAEQTGTDFVRMDGLHGFLFAAEKLGELRLDGAKVVDLEWLASFASEALGEDQILSALRDAAKNNPRIEAYRLAVEASQEPRPRQKPEEINTLTYVEIKSRLTELKGLQADHWGEHASASDLELAANDLVIAQTPEERLAFLRIFSRRPFPLDRGLLLQLAATHHEHVAVAAASALGQIAHSSVRELAFRLVETRLPGRQKAIAMLSRNWQPGDHEIAVKWFAQEEDRAVRHRMGLDLRSCWDAHPEASTKPRMLLTIYEKGPCSECRESALSRLIELGSLPESIREECAYDASEDIRELVSATKR